MTRTKDAALLDAAEVETLTLTEREADGHSGGGVFTRMAWSELKQGTTRLDAWCAALRAEGLLD